MTAQPLPFDFNVDPATLRVGSPADEGVLALYERYRHDLARVCQEAGAIRQRMLAGGYSADFSDREAEVLYLLVRSLQPEVVVEISPCHGYSTNYLLAALTHNEKGTLYSFEIQTEVRGRPIADVISGNLSPQWDRARWQLRVGDVRAGGPVPRCDFLFLDSCHEADFAAWYCEALLETPGCVMVHDILISGSARDILLPKAALLGVAEPYYLLEALAANRQSCWSVAAFDQRADRAWKARLPVRHPGAGERSIVFSGHKNSAASRQLAAGQAEMETIRTLSRRGFRDTALARIEALQQGEAPLLTKLQAAACLAHMGYRHPAFADKFPRLEIDYRALTVSQLVALLELAVTSCNRKLLDEAAASARDSGIDPRTLRYLVGEYQGMAGKPQWAARLSELPKRLLARA